VYVCLYIGYAHIKISVAIFDACAFICGAAGGSVLLAGSGVCYIPELCSLSKQQKQALIQGMQCVIGLVSIIVLPIYL